jgi:hypothetical protein
MVMFIGVFGASRLICGGGGADWGGGSHPGCGCKRKIVLFSKAYRIILNPPNEYALG